MQAQAHTVQIQQKIDAARRLLSIYSKHHLHLFQRAPKYKPRKNVFLPFLSFRLPIPVLMARLILPLLSSSKLSRKMMWSTSKEQRATIWLHKSCNDDGATLSQLGHLLLPSYENVCLLVWLGAGAHEYLYLFMLSLEAIISCKNCFCVSTELWSYNYILQICSIILVVLLQFYIQRLIGIFLG